MLIASSKRREIKHPFNSTAIGSFKGARNTTSTSVPEIKPSSSSLELMCEVVIPEIVPLLPGCNCANV